MLDIAGQTTIFNHDSILPIDKIVKEGVMKIAAVEASRLLRECNYEKQTRHLNAGGKAHISVLADIMRRNQWRPFEKIDFVQVDGKLLIINGYHRLSAQVASGASIKWVFVIHKCKTFDEVAALYYTFDTNLKPRTNSQILDVIGAAELLGVSKTTAIKVYQAVPLIIADFDFGRASFDPIVHRMIDTRMEKVKSFQAPAVQWESATKKAPTPIKKRLSTQGGLAVALVCFKYQPAEAERFWRGLAENNGLLVGDARRTYLVALGNTSSSGTAYTLAMQTAIAWNAWFSGRELKQIKIVSDARFRIDGTPFNGR